MLGDTFYAACGDWQSGEARSLGLAQDRQWGMDSGLAPNNNDNDARTTVTTRTDEPAGALQHTDPSALGNGIHDGLRHGQSK